MSIYSFYNTVYLNRNLLKQSTFFNRLNRLIILYNNLQKLQKTVIKEQITVAYLYLIVLNDNSTMHSQHMLCFYLVILTYAHGCALTVASSFWSSLFLHKHAVQTAAKCC